MTLPYRPLLPDDTVNVTQTHPLAEGARVLGGIVLALATLYGVSSLLVWWLVPILPPSLEQWLAHSNQAMVDRLVAVPEPTRQCQQIMARLLRQHPVVYRVDIKVIEAQPANAMALPGGHILMTQSLYDDLKTSDQRAFVLAHELSHLIHRDHLRGMGHAFLLKILLGLLTSQESSAKTVEAMGQLSHLGDLRFSREQELAADAEALGLIKAAGFCPAGAREALTALMTLEKNTPQPPAFLSTHPPTVQRLERLPVASPCHSHN